MRVQFSSFLVAAAAVGASVVPHSAKYTLKESHPVPARWHEITRAPASEKLTLRIGLKQERFAELERHLYEVSDPKHARYGQHLCADEVNAIIAPSETASNLVHDWLSNHGVDRSRLSYSAARDWINVRMSVGEIEELLQTKYSIFEDRDGNAVIRTREWSLPEYLHEHVATIQPTNNFMRPRKKAKSLKYLPGSTVSQITPPPSNATLAGLYDPLAVTPAFLRTLYGTINYTVQAADKNKMALNDFLGEINNRSDASLYLQTFRPEAVQAAYQFQQISVDNGTLQQTPLNSTQLEAGTGVEGNLDLQTMLGVAWPTPLVAYSTGGLNPVFIPDLYTPTDSDEPYVEWLQYILALNDTDLPTVISTSYGDDEQTIPYSYAAQACSGFAQLGARGVTVLFSSGDEGVGGDGTCYSNDGRNVSTFLPSFPPTCPYVTTVGATMRFGPEVAVYDDHFSVPFTSGAGFSNYFKQPYYQSRAVNAYLNQTVGSMYAGLYNASGRAYPEISGQSSNFTIFWNGTGIPVSGTSASCPLVSSVIALVNDALLAANRSTLGFMNPWIYGGGYWAFTDILNGSSAGCDTDGFPAAPGWDAVTGFGTPFFPYLLEALGLEPGETSL